jgi:hypothetical protein
MDVLVINFWLKKYYDEKKIFNYLLFWEKMGSTALCYVLT